MPSIAYRPEIDGLRALAIIPVVLFHTGLMMPGGYVGVDVFFVISGFLIGSIVTRDIESGSFSMRQFWMRRIRRLFPAWAVMACLTMAFGYLLLMPAHLQMLGESLQVQPLMIANFHFWQQFDYFSVESEFLPLLHTWSLAVEEQFYIFLPLVALWALKKRAGRKAFGWVIAVSALISLSLSGIVSKPFPEFAFFLPFTRIWELSLGVGISLMPWDGQFLKKSVREVVAWFAIALVIVPCFLFDSATVFPGLAAAIPCLGAGLLLIVFRSAESSAKRFLQFGGFVWIGKISYPIYLFHWPAIVFFRYYVIEEPEPIWWGVLIIGVTIFSWLITRFVENPIRTGAALSTDRKLLLGASLVVIPVVSIGYFFDSSEGAPNRFPDSTVSFEAKLAHVNGFYPIEDWKEKGGPPIIGEKGAECSVMLWGDSHSMALLELFDELGKEFNIEVIPAVQAGSPPLFDVYALRGREADVSIPEVVSKYVSDHSVDAIFMVARWPLYLEGDGGGRWFLRTLEENSASAAESRSLFSRELAKTTARLTLGGRKVWLMESVATQERSVPEMLMRLDSRGKDLNLLSRTGEYFRSKDRKSNELIEQLGSELGIHILDPLPFFLDQNGRYQISAEGKSLYWDDDHLSRHGANLLKPLFAPIFRELKPTSE
mgnify:CR=1 FL=1